MKFAKSRLSANLPPADKSRFLSLPGDLFKSAKRSRALLLLLAVFSAFWTPVLAEGLAAVSGDLSGRLLQRAEWVFEHASEVHYRHYKHKASEQIYENDSGGLVSINDCSGFVSYLPPSVHSRNRQFLGVSFSS